MRTNLLLICFSCLLFGTAATTTNADVEWVGYQNGCMVAKPTDASFFDSDNWFGFVVPGPDSIALLGSGFDPGGDAYPTTIYFGDVCVDVFACPGPVPYPADTADTYELIIEDDDFIFDFGPAPIGCAPAANDTGACVIDHRFRIGRLTTQGGLQGDASLTVRNGDITLNQVDHISGFFLGDQVGTSGDLILSGSAVHFACEPQAVVGIEGNGFLRVENGATAYFDEGFRIAQQNGATGLMQVDGPGSAATGFAFSHWGLNVGGWRFGTTQAEGRLEITNGGYVEADDATIGSGNYDLGTFDDIKGWLLIDGAGSRLKSLGAVHIGTAGIGSTTVANGGILEAATDLIVGKENDSFLEIKSGGEVIVGWSLFSATTAASISRIDLSDTGKLTTLGQVVIGHSGNGTLTVRNGARFIPGAFGDLRIGSETGSNGSLLITGTGSGVENVRSVSVGGAWWTTAPGTGAVRIEDGADVVFRDLQIAAGAYPATPPGGIQGSLMIDGLGSVLTTTSFTTIGEAGIGSTSVCNGAILNVGDVLNVGYRDIGRLHIESGGVVVDSAGLMLASFVEGDGAVTIADSASLLHSVGLMRIGSQGKGMVSVTGGTVIADYQILLGNGAAAVGSLCVSGANSLVRVSDRFTVGVEGTGRVEVLDGGCIDADTNTVTLGQQNGADGVLCIRGAGSELINVSDLVVGGPFGTPSSGLLVVENQGCARIINSTQVGTSGHSGRIRVDGASSLFEVGQSASFGASGGTGVLELRNDGTFDSPMTTIDQGGLLEGRGSVSGIVTIAGEISPGSDSEPIGEISTGGAIVPTTGGVSIQIGGTVPGFTHDRWTVFDSLELGGDLNVALIDSFAPAPGDTFAIIEVVGATKRGVMAGDFDCFTGMELGGGLSLNPIQTATSYFLVVGASGNTNPVGSDDTDTTTAIQTILLSPLANDFDSDGDALKISALDVTSATGSVSILSDSVLQYVPDVTFAGVDSFTYYMTDCLGGLDSAVVMVRVGTATDVRSGDATPRLSLLLPNVPNPFNPATEIRWMLGTGGESEITIYDVTGQLVRNLYRGETTEGRHAATWDGRNDQGEPVASGVYFARLKTGGTTESRRMLLLR